VIGCKADPIMQLTVIEQKLPILVSIIVQKLPTYVKLQRVDFTMCEQEQTFYFLLIFDPNI